MNENRIMRAEKAENWLYIDINRENVLFYLSYVIWLGMNILVDSAYESFAYFSDIFGMTNIICLALIGIHLLRNKFTVSKLPVLFLCGACVLISAAARNIICSLMPLTQARKSILTVKNRSRITAVILPFE